MYMYCTGIVDVKAKLNYKIVDKELGVVKSFQSINY